MNLVEDVADYARQHGLWQPDSAIVIACSGGPIPWSSSTF